MTKVVPKLSLSGIINNQFFWPVLAVLALLVLPLPSFQRVTLSGEGTQNPENAVALSFSSPLGARLVTALASLGSGRVPAELGEKVVAYINDNLVSDGGVTLVSVVNLGQIYEVNTLYQGYNISTYVTQDGRYLLPGSGLVFDMSSLPVSDLGSKTILFINTQLLDEDTQATLVETKDADIPNLVQVSFTYLDMSDFVFVTRDGKYLLLPGGMLDMTVPVEMESSTSQVPELIQTARPEVHGFVMSYCPYGLQFLKAYVQVMEVLGEEADLELNFCNYIMHGQTEIVENNHLYCIQRDQPEVFTEYVRCFVEAGNSAGCFDEVGVNTDTLNTCLVEIDNTYAITELFENQSTWYNGRYPMYLVDETLNSQYGIGGSPSLVVNGMVVPAARSAEALKQTICMAFIEAPDACNQVLNTATENAGLGPVGAGTSSTTSAAECG
ncbi:MAG TPA: hypothetical protein ENN60_00815 [archaeon]|nr:hypothetical protein [archaeon]